MKRLLIFCVALILVLPLVVVSTAAAATTYYVDPVNGLNTNPGTSALPWKTIKSSGLVSGNTILLRAGNYGNFSMSNKNFSSTLTIAAESWMARPVFTNILVTNCNKVKISTVDVANLKHSPRANEIRYNLISCTGDNIEISNCCVSTMPWPSMEPTLSWDAGQWNTKASSGIQVWGDGAYIHDNGIYGVDFGIEVEGDDSVVSYNQVSDFCGDGINLKGIDNEVCSRNLVANHYKTNDNHGDMIQVYRWDDDNNGPITNLVLDSNYCIARNDAYYWLQYSNQVNGIGSFDNNLVNGRIINNVVLLTGWNGIYAYGGVGTQIINNTVFDAYSYDDPEVDHPVISIEEAQNGANSNGCIVRNNICHDVWTVGATNPVIDHNIIAWELDPAELFSEEFFVSYTPYLNPDSPAVDTGSGTLAPAYDIWGIQRPLDAGFDIGAFEYFFT